MAEIIEGTHMECDKKYASNSKGNSALTLGIIGTALGAMSAVGSGFSLFGGCPSKRDTCNGTTTGESAEALHLERMIHANYDIITNREYENKLSNIRELADAFYKLDKQDTDNSFKLYQYSRDSKDELNDKIAKLQSKVDVMAAVRPYQDALIDMRIHNAEQQADINLFKRTCKMIEGTLVLPDSSISGFPTYGTRFVNN